MKKVFPALAALMLAAPAYVGAQDVAPPVKREPAAQQGASAVTIADPQAASAARAEEYRTALTAVAAQSGSDDALDRGLVRVMSSLAGVGRCGDAAGLAARERRQDLAARVQQFCE